MNKKIIFNLLTLLIVAILNVGLLSCSKDDDDEVTPTTYTLKWNFETSYIDDVTLFEYSESGDKIANHRVSNLYKNGSYKFTAAEKAAKVKVYFEMGGSVRWVQQVYYLKKESNTDIDVTSTSLVGRSEP